MEPLHNALEILHQIVNHEYVSSVTDDYYFFPAGYFANQYGISDRTFKRYIGDMRLLGAALYSERSSSGGYVWRCRNWRSLVQSATYRNWLLCEREKASGFLLVRLHDDIPAQRVCVMNCGPVEGDTRTRAERMASCSDCEPVRASNREESKYHFDDEGFNKP